MNPRKFPLLLCLSIVLAIASDTNAAEPAKEDHPVSDVAIVSTEKPAPLPAALLEKVKEGMTLGDLVDLLGRGWIYRWSSTGYIQWFFTDGSELSILPERDDRKLVITFKTPPPKIEQTKVMMLLRHPKRKP